MKPITNPNTNVATLDGIDIESIFSKNLSGGGAPGPVCASILLQ